MNRRAAATRTRFVSCFDPGERQFGGMLAVLRDCATLRGFSWTPWEGGLVADEGAGTLIISGHGSPVAARIGDGAVRFLGPDGVGAAHSTRLYLLCCYQGKDEIRSAWARGTGLPVGRVHGAEEETETLLSTLFLLHVKEAGAGRVGHHFNQWVLANRIIRPLFGPARELYGRTGGDPIAVLEFLERAADLRPVRTFLEPARRNAELLAGLLPA